MTITGVYRYVPHSQLLFRLAQGWQWAGDLGTTHGEWSSYMWWCCGQCEDAEPPR